jgi:fructokinase
MITVIGEALIELVPTSDNTTLRVRPAGSPLNVAMEAARLGHPTALMARLSADRFGQFLRRYASRSGVDLSAAPEAEESTTLAVATPGATAHASSFYLQGTADWQWSTAELARIPAATTVLHPGSLACCMAPGAARILRAVARRRSRGTVICLDANVSRAVLRTPARGRLLVERAVMAADVVKASLDDLGWLYPGRGPESVAGHWLDLGPGLVVITCGGDGAMALRAGGTVLHRPAYRAQGVDTAGQGDAFTAALLGGLHQLSQARAGHRALSGEDLSSEDLGRLLDTCAFAAGLAREQPGADLPAAAALRPANGRLPATAC